MHECVRLEDDQPLHLVCIQNCFSSVLLTPQSLFQRTDDASGGSLQTFKRWLKFRLRCFWHRPHVLAVHDHLHQLAFYVAHSWLLCEWTLKERHKLRCGVGGGNVQGSQEGKDLVKDFTQLMERTRPSGILLNALQGLAQGWGLVGLLGVSDVGHAYADYRSLSQRVGMSYDTLWQELGAEQRLSDMHWSLPLVWLPRPESEVASSKRSQLRRRNDMRQQVQSACLAAAQRRP